MLLISIRSKLLLCASALLFVMGVALPLHADFPKPSPYPISWELAMAHSKPKRIVMQAPRDKTPMPYWYMTYHVVNNTTKDKITFLPVFEMMTEAGMVIRSDSHTISPAVFERVKSIERNLKFLQADASGDLRQGEDQSRDGVAIWREPTARMGTFSIFASGFSGEAVDVKEDDKIVKLHKTLQITYRLSSDENHPNEGELVELNSQDVMR
jgi:hypothetical protein